MSRKYLTHIDLNSNELQNAVIQNLSTAPTGVLGRIYFDTSSGVNQLKIYNGSSWQSVGQVSLTLQGEVTGSASTNASGEITLTTTVDYAGSLTASDVNTALGYTAADAADLSALSTSINTGTIDATTINTVDLNVSGTIGLVGNGEFTITGNDNIVIVPGVGNNLYIGSSIDPNNQVATIGDILTDLTGYVTETGSQTLTNKTIDNAKVTGTTSFRDGSDTEYVRIEQSYTGTTRIISTDDLALRSNDGDIILYPGNDNGGTGRAYVHWGNDATGAFPEHEITTAGNSQTLTNKTVGDNLYFNDGTAAGYITSNAGTLEVNANNALNIDALSDITITSTNGDIVINPSGDAYINSVAADNKVATIGDLTAVQSGLTWKEAVNLLWDNAVTNTGASGTFVIDGHSALTSANNGYRILALGAGTDSGIYVYNDDGTNWILTRAIDADTDAELKGAAVFVEEGTIYGATAWVQQNHYITSFADQNWVQFSGQGTYVAGDGLELDGNEFTVKLDSDSLAKSANGLKANLAVNGGLDNDGGLYVKTADGVKLDLSGNVTVDTAIVARKYSATLTSGDNSYLVGHGLDTYDVQVQVYDTNGSTVEVDVTRTGLNTVLIETSVNTTSNLRVVVIG